MQLEHLPQDLALIGGRIVPVSIDGQKFEMGGEYNPRAFVAVPEGQYTLRSYCRVEHDGVPRHCEFSLDATGGHTYIINYKQHRAAARNRGAVTTFGWIKVATPYFLLNDFDRFVTDLFPDDAQPTSMSIACIRDPARVSFVGSGGQVLMMEYAETEQDAQEWIDSGDQRPELPEWYE